LRADGRESRGTPSFLTVPNDRRTQHGNNNGFCQDSALSWYDWTLAQSPTGIALQNFVARLIGLRRELTCLRCDYFQHGLLEPVPQVRDIEWFDENGDTIRLEDWQYWEGRLLCVRRARRLDDGRAELCLLLANNTIDEQTFPRRSNRKMPRSRCRRKSTRVPSLAPSRILSAFGGAIRVAWSVDKPPRLLLL
jgi:glycogen operon protein